MEKWHEVSSRIEQHLRPATFPVAVRLLSPGEEPPERSRRPAADIGSPMALCQGLTLTRTRGWTMAFGPEDSNCPVANYAMGWGGQVDPSLMYGFLQMMNYAADEASARARVEGLSRLEPGEFPTLVFSPLARTRVEPQVVVVYGNPAQVMRMVHAASRWTGDTVAAGFGGIAGSCNEGFIRTFREDAPRVALPGNGDRVFAATRDDEILFAFPASWAERIVEGLETTSASGVRYPIPTMLEYELPFDRLMSQAQEE